MTSQWSHRWQAQPWPGLSCYLHCRPRGRMSACCHRPSQETMEVAEKWLPPNDRNAFWRLRGKYMLFFAEKDKLFTTVLSFKYISLYILSVLSKCISRRLTYCIVLSYTVYRCFKKVQLAKTYLHDGTIRIACIIINTTFPEVALFVLLNRIMLIFRAWKEQLFQV